MRILVVSDIGVVRESLYYVLSRQGGVEVVGAVDLPQAREHGALTQPEVILFDVGRQSSVDVVREVVASAPRSKVVAFGVRETEEDILALAAAGTAGYISDNVRSGDIVGVLQQVLRDELACSPRAAASLYRCVGSLSQQHNGSPAPTLPLSRRELQIAELIDYGLTNKEIGRRLGIEAATVKNHVHNLCEKLNVHRRGEATARIRGMLNGSLADQNPAARNHVGQPWADIGQPGGAASASAASELSTPRLKV